MLTKPNLKDEEIVACLKNEYEINVTTISFLPLGADFNTAVYRVTTKEIDYFLKLRNGKFLEASVLVPKHLAHLGTKQVIPPLATTTNQLWTSLGIFKIILYPYVEGDNGIERKLSSKQWAQIGKTIKKLHDTKIPKNITSGVPLETFSSKWRENVKTFLNQIENETFEYPVAKKAAIFLKSKKPKILKMIEQAENFALTIQKQQPKYVLCHADIHGWNLIINKNALFIVDWDTLIFAPKERDLMFIGAGIWNSGYSPDEEEHLFYQGYGQTITNQIAICYYRLERIIQDIGEYCQHIFLSEEGCGDKKQSFEYLKSNFLPNGTIERAYLINKTKELFETKKQT